MTDDQTADDGVKIYAPRKIILEKMGVASLDEVILPQQIKAAQEIINNASTEIVDEVGLLLEALETAAGRLPDKAILPEIGEHAFAIKSTAGMAGYDLLSAVAKSLQLYVASLDATALTLKNREIIQWHAASLRQIWKLDVKGAGGKIGDAIMAELARIAPPSN